MSRVQNPPQLDVELILHNAILNREAVAEIFLPTDVEAILSILVCTKHVYDFWSWVHEKNGVFSVGQNIVCLLLQN